jgi:hypothetical protein
VVGHAKHPEDKAQLLRQQLVVIATLGESLFRFWRIPRENRLRREIIELLRPHSSAGADGSA